MLKILFIEDLPSDVELAVLELRKELVRFEYNTVCTRADLISALEDFNPDLIISDYMMPAYNGLEALRDVKKFDDTIPFILYTGSINEETAVECIKAGAEDYVIKEHMTRLPFAVKEALSQIRIRKEKKVTDHLLKESEEKIQSIFRAAPVGIGLVTNRVLTEVNDTFCKMTGYSKKELIGKDSRMLYFSQEDYDFVGNEKYRQIGEAGTGTVETRFRRKDGGLINIFMSSTPLDKSDYSKGVTFTVLDITDRYKTEESLKLSEEKFRSIAENLSDVIFITDLKGTIIYISPSCRVFGYDPEEFPGKFFGDFLAEGELEKAMQVFNNAINSINISNIASLVFKRKDGSRFYAELSGSTFNTGNETTGVLGLIRDVSDKMKREIEVRKLSRAVEQNPVSIVITDTEGIIEYVNHKMCEVTGYTREELLGRNPSVLSSKEMSKEEYKTLWDTIKRGDDWKGEFHNRKKNGELYWESATLSPIKNENDEITHFLGIKEDITHRKIMEEATRESEKRYRELFLNNPVPTYIFDENTLAFVEVNDTTVDNYGYSREEFAKMTLRDLRIPEDLHDLEESVRHLGAGTFYSASMRHKKKNGTLFPVEITSHSLPEKNGRKTRLVMAIDITERIKAAEQMKLAREKAEASDKLKTTFLNNISHEVRTPLNGILGFAEIMSQPDLTESEKLESLTMLQESSDRLLETITNYMDISLLTSANISVIRRDFFPEQVLRNVLKSYRAICASRNLGLSLEIPDKIITISVNSDPEIFRKIISHLLNNAIKFTEKGSISFGYDIEGDNINFFVRDTGIGIGKESIGIIFDRFVKEDRGPSKLSEGSGLGLSIAKGLVVTLGGEMWVESELEKGSTFYVSLPIKENVKQVNDIIHLTEGEIRNDNSKTLVLVAEDDETNYFYLNTILVRELNASVIHAKNGREAIDLFKSNAGINLILMDIKMPELDGLEATRQIKLLNPNIPVIAVTAYAMMGDEDRFLEAGCDGYLSKPISKKKLLDKMSEFVKI